MIEGASEYPSPIVRSCLNINDIERSFDKDSAALSTEAFNALHRSALVGVSSTNRDSNMSLSKELRVSRRLVKENAKTSCSVF